MKKINLGVCFGTIMIALCLLFETGYAATYYVKNSGNDNASGLDDNTAWRTIGKVNGFDFSDGDIVLFNRGDTFSDKTLQLKNVENFTIADYGEGEKPLFDGNKVQPLIISDSKNVIVKNIDISGQEWQIDISSNIYVENVEGLIIDGVYGNGHTTNGKGKSEGKTAITITAGSGEIEIKNCEIFNWGPYDLPKIDTEDFMGIALMNMDIGEYKIHDNKIYNINADAIHVSLTNAQGAIYDNILYNSGADAIDITGSENCEIYDNEFYRTAEFLGEGGKGSGGLPTYINLHEGEERVSKNITINSNNFKDGDCVAIKLGNAESTNIYENNFSNVKSALYIQDLVTNTVFHHNIIENPQSRPTENGFDAGSIYENNSYTGTQIYNNTIYNGKGDCKHLIALECSNKTSIYNNIAYQNNSSEDAFGLYHNSCVTGTEPVISNNYWYNPGKINRTKYSNEIYTANMQEEWNEKHSSGDKFDAPLMNDPEEGDYSLYEKSLKVGAVYSKEDNNLLSEVKDYYVDATLGNDSWSGTSMESPWQTLAKINEHSFSPGDTIYLKRGEIWEEELIVPSSGSSGAPITFTGYGIGNNPKIKLTNTFSDWTLDIDTQDQKIWKGQLTNIKNSWGAVKAGSDTRSPRYLPYTHDSEWTAPEEIAEMKNSFFYAPYNKGTFYFRHDEGNPGTMEIGARRFGILVEGKSYITIDGIDVFGPGGNFENGSTNQPQIDIDSSTHVIIKNCTLSLHNMHGAMIRNGSSDCVYENITCYGHNSTGLYFWEAGQDNQAINCEVYNCGNEITDSGDMGLIGVFSTPNVLIENCYVHDNGHSDVENIDAAISIVQSSDAYVKRCQIERAGGTAIQFAEDSNSGTAAYNIIKGWGVVESPEKNHGIQIGGGIGTSTAYNCQIYNNLFFNNDTISGEWAALRIRYRANKGLRVRNNIFYNNDGIYDIFAESKDNFEDWVFSNNLFHRRSGNAIKWSASAWDKIEKEGYQDIAVYDKDHIIGKSSGYYSFDKNLETDSIVSDPKLTTDHMGLYENSPCIAKGIDVGLSIDFYGNEVNKADGINIGPFE
jgi:hypothetical protein